MLAAKVFLKLCSAEPGASVRCDQRCCEVIPNITKVSLFVFTNFFVISFGFSFFLLICV
jgi:hypothetical protein